MKFLTSFVLAICLIFACMPKNESTSEPTNGFGPYEGQSVYLGDDTYVDLFKKLDAAWAARDYETMKSLISNDGVFVFEDGTTVNNGSAFTEKVEAEYQASLNGDSPWGWETDYAFAAYPKGSDDPKATNQAGQWVNAQFTSADATYIEWYQFVDGKLKTWYQSKGNFVFEK